MLILALGVVPETTLVGRTEILLKGQECTVLGRLGVGARSEENDPKLPFANPTPTAFLCVVPHAIFYLHIYTYDDVFLCHLRCVKN